MGLQALCLTINVPFNKQAQISTLWLEIESLIHKQNIMWVEAVNHAFIGKGTILPFYHLTLNLLT